MLGNGWVFRATVALGLATGAVGVGGLLVGCALVVHEVRLALRYISQETEPTTYRSAVL